MHSCKSQYDYNNLIANYFDANLKPQYTSGELLIKPSWTSTAGKRLNFRGEYLFSYRTPIARIVRTKHNNYLFISTCRYSNTTSRQIQILRECVPNSITVLNVDDIDNSFCDIKDQYLSIIKDTYSICRTARQGSPLRGLVTISKQAILSIVPELHHRTAAATLRKLALLPDIPNKLDKFTRTALFSVLKERKLL